MVVNRTHPCQTFRTFCRIKDRFFYLLLHDDNRRWIYGFCVKRILQLEESQWGKGGHGMESIMDHNQ